MCTIYERGARFTLFIGLFVKMFASSCNRRCIRASLSTACNSVQSNAGKCKCAQNSAKLCSAVKYCVLSLLYPQSTHILKGIVHQIVFYRSNLIFWIVMGCGIAHFGQRGL